MLLDIHIKVRVQLAVPQWLITCGNPGEFYILPTGILRRYHRFSSRPLQQCEYHNKASCSLLAGGGSCLQLVELLQHLWSVILWSTIKWGMPAFPLSLGKLSLSVFTSICHNKASLGKYTLKLSSFAKCSNIVHLKIELCFANCKVYTL